MTAPLRFTQELRATFKLAAPLAAAQLSQVGMGVTDTVMLGALGGHAIAAGGLASGLFFMSIMILQGPASAVGILIAHARGAATLERIAPALRAGFALALLALIPQFAFTWNLETLLGLLGEPEALKHDVGAYSRVLILGAPGLMWLTTQRVFLASMNHPKMVMVVSVAGLILNAVLNYGLIHGRLGMPELGMLGSATATVITTWTMTLTTHVMIRITPQVGSHMKLGPVEWPLVRETFKLGWPIGMTIAVEGGLFMASSLIMGIIGVTALAAHQVTLNVASLTFMIPLAVGQAANVRVGYHMGAKAPLAARRAGFAAFVLGVGFMSLSALAMFTLPREIAGLFSLDASIPDNAAVITLAVQLLMASAAFQVFDGAQCIALGALRGLKDTRMPMILAGLGYWVVGFPAAWAMAFAFGVGPMGVWWGLALGLAVVAVVLCVRFLGSSSRIIAAHAA